MEVPSGVESPPPDVSRVRRLVGAAALLVGAVLAVAGSLLPLYRQELAFATETVTLRLTLWGTESSVQPGQVPILFGVPVAVASVLLAVAAASTAAAPRFSPRLAGPTSIVAMAGAALLTGSVWTVGQLVFATVSVPDSPSLLTAVEAGTGTLALAFVVALVGAVLVQHWPDRVPVRAARPQGAVVHRLPDDDGRGGGR